MPDFKSFVRGKIKQYQKESKENKKFKEELKAKVKKARRNAFIEESVKRAAEQSRRRAKQLYAPKPQSSGYYNQPISPAMQNLIWGGTPAKSMVEQTIKKKTRKSKKKRK